MRTLDKIQTILLMSFLYILASCYKTEANKLLFCNTEEEAKARYLLDFADSIMETNPDTAYTLLRRDSAIICRTGKAGRMMFTMLKTQAQDKLYIPHTSDSQIREVVKYYEEYGTQKQKAQAYYLLGRVCHDLSLTASSVSAFQKALEMNDDNPTIYRYKGQSASWLGTIFNEKRLYEKSLKYNILSHKFATKSDIPSKLSIFSLRNIGRTYSDLGKNNYAIKYYKKAAQLAKENNDMYLYTMVVGELCAIYIEENMLNDAELLLSLPTKYIPQVDLAPYYNTIGKYYEAKECPDTAIFYYKKGLATGSLKAKGITSLNIADIYERQNLHDKAREYYELNKLYEDSIERQSLIEMSDNLRLIEEKADIQKQNEELSKDKSTRNYIIYVIVAAALSGGIVTFCYIKKQISRNELERKREKCYWKQRAENDADKLKQKQEQIKQLKQVLASHQQTTDNINKEQTNPCSEKKIQTLPVEVFKNSNIYNLFHKTVFSPKEEDFTFLENSLDSVYNGFTSRLRQICPNISIDEVRICCLLKIGLTPKEIGNHLSFGLSTISMKRKRLYKKIHNKEGKAEDFDLFIKNF